MSNIAFIGPTYLAEPLQASGISVFGSDSGKAANSTLEELCLRGKHQIIFITEGLASECNGTIEQYRDQVNIVLLPDISGSTGLYKEKTNKLIREATGAISI